MGKGSKVVTPASSGVIFEVSKRIPRGALSNSSRKGLILPKEFWVTKSKELNLEVQVEAEDGRRFTRHFQKLFQRNKPYVHVLDIDQEILDYLGVELEKDECLVQLINPTLIKISKVIENGRGGTAPRSKRPARGGRAGKRPAKEISSEEEEDSDFEEYMEKPRSPRKNPRGRGQTGKTTSVVAAAAPARSLSPTATSPIVVGVGTKLLIGPPIVARWQLCPVLRLLRADNGSVATEIKITIESSESRTGRSEIQIPIPILEAQNRADAGAPGALQGAEIYKKFEDGLWYIGQVCDYDRKHGWYRIVYEDGDSEEMETDEVLELLYESLPSWDFCAPWQVDINPSPPLPLPPAPASLPVQPASAPAPERQKKRHKILEQSSPSQSGDDENDSEEYVIDIGNASSEEYAAEEEEEEAMEVESPRKHLQVEEKSSAAGKAQQKKSSSSTYKQRLQRKAANGSSAIEDNPFKRSRRATAPVISPPPAPHNYPLAGDGGGGGAAAVARVHSPPLAPATAPVEDEAGAPVVAATLGETEEGGSLPDDVLTALVAAAGGGGGSSGATAPATAAAAATRAPQRPAPAVLIHPPPSDSSDVYNPCGAGHQRGAIAYDRHNKTFRPIGKWIIDKKIGTLLGRFSVDKRCLDSQEESSIITVRSDAVVPGWIGVRGTFHEFKEQEEQQQQAQDGAKNKSIKKKKSGATKYGFLGAPYTLVYYEQGHAKQCHLLYPTFDTVEEAAKMYDQFALSYYDPAEVDLNYPLDPTERTAAAFEWKKEHSKVSGRNNFVLLAVDILNFERSIPDGAVIEGAATSEDWEKFEKRFFENYILNPPKYNVAKELGKELAWVLEQLSPEGFFPSWRSEENKKVATFIQDCKQCDALGQRYDHYHKNPATCHLCFLTKAKCERKHGCKSLFALVSTAVDCIVSNKAFDALAEGGSAEVVERAAQEEENELFEKAKKGLAGGAARRKKVNNDEDDDDDEEQERPKPKSRQKSNTATAGGQIKSSYNHQSIQQIPAGLHVVVIGAGVSGLKAAADLQRSGAKVTILEARNRIGGRIHTHTLTPPSSLNSTIYPTTTPAVPIKVDLGATFVCGTSREAPVNPLVPFMKDYLQLPMCPKHREGPKGAALYDIDGSRIPLSEQLAAEEQYEYLLEQLLERGEESARRRGKTAINSGEESVADATEAIMATMNLTDLQKRIVSCYASDLYVATQDQLSLHGSISSGYDGDHELVQGGYGQLVDAIAAGKEWHGVEEQPLRDIRLNFIVEKIELVDGGKGVKIHRRNDNSLERTAPEEGGEVSEKEKIVEADAVLVTLPLGVLKAQSVEFAPPLPNYKLESINGLGMGTENRVAMLFDAPFWPETPHFLRPLSGDYTFANVHALGVPNTLCAWVRPGAVDRVEALTDEEALEEVLSVLRTMFKGTPIPYPVSYVVTRWARDPYSQGAYSYVPVGGRKQYFEWLSYPVTGDTSFDARAAKVRLPLRKDTRMYFAGEATHKRDAYTVHGAMMSGKREGKRIREWWKEYHRELLKT